MKSLFPKLLVALVVTIVSVFVFASTRSSNRQENPPKGNLLKWYAAKAKKDGKQKVVVPGLMVEHVGSATKEIDETISDYTVVRARLISQHTYQVDGDHLLTWNKFSIVDTLTDLKTPPSPNFLSLTPPMDLPIDYATEFFVPRTGGVIRIDDVEVHEVEPDFPEFQTNQEYLLFVLLYPNRVAVTAGGPYGVFTIASGDRLIPFNKDSDKIKQGVESKFGNSLARLKQYLKRP
ncbi:MAG TPA: hypothetical protein VE980_25400 [Pyrinomonadaceae bacterium]|nr:hypothetical protein [Pyrinomonadaceae bacterium]